MTTSHQTSPRRSLGQRSRKLRPGDSFSSRQFVTIGRETVEVPAPAGFVHIQFRRFAGCPVCNLHLRSVVQRLPELEAAGIRELVLFHADAEELSRHAAELPLAVVADPEKRLYREFGVESGARALLSPRAWLPILKAVAVSLAAYPRGRQRPPRLFPRGGRLGLPADILVAPDGQVVASKYGEHAHDQWSVDEVLRLVAAAKPATT